MRLLKWIAYAYILIFTPILKGENNTLIIGTTSGYAPFVSLNAQGGYEGFDIDVAQLVALKLNRTLVIKDLGSMPSLMIGLTQGKIDALIWAVSITEERKNRFNLIHYQGEPTNSLPLLFWKTIPPGVERAEQLVKLPTKGICVEAGSYQEHVLQGLGFTKLKNVNSITEAILELKYGKSTAIAVDYALIPTLLAQNPELQVLNSPLPARLQEMGNGIAVKKENRILSEEIEQAISTLKAEGKIRELETKWGLQ